MQTKLFEYALPHGLIAAAPAERREESRLMVLRREAQTIKHRRFEEIGEFLRGGDLLVINDSKVIRARLRGRRLSTGGSFEFLLLERVKPTTSNTDTWRVMCRPARKLKPGEIVYFANKRLEARITHYAGEGEREVEFSTPDILPWLDEIGEVPLPPYILHRRKEIEEGARHDQRTSHPRLPFSSDMDAERYQTVYAREPGSVAAPTAGLHFTSELMERLRGAGIEFARVTLHVGAGTFKPVETEEAEQHRMHTEHFTIPAETADAVNRARDESRRVIAVGTTSVRALETIADQHGHVRAGEFDTNLLILPGYQFKSVDALITNFHLPRSTLLMLVCAFAGREFVLRAYEEAVRNQYRFYSFGDAMLIT